MEFHRACSPRNLRDIPRRNPTPRHNNHPPSRPSHQLRNPRHRLRGGNRSPRSQQPRRSRCHDILQRRKQIHTLIKRPMKRNRQNPCLPDQLCRPRNIDGPVSLQQSQHNSIHSSQPRHINRRAHLLELRRRINEIPATRPHHRKYRNAHSRAPSAHQLHAGRHSSNFERSTQFNPRSATAFRRDRPLHTVHRNLHHSSARHRFSPIPNFSFPFSDFHSPVSFAVFASLTSPL
jgi:hypothetical protein